MQSKALSAWREALQIVLRRLVLVHGAISRPAPRLQVRRFFWSLAMFCSYSHSYPSGEFSYHDRETSSETAFPQVVFVCTIGDNDRFSPDGGCAGPKESLAITAARLRGTFYDVNLTAMG